jgi:hypothetical protein
VPQWIGELLLVAKAGCCVCDKRGGELLQVARAGCYERGSHDHPGYCVDDAHLCQPAGLNSPPPLFL